MEAEKKEFEEGDPLAMVRMFLDMPADDRFYDRMARTFVEEYAMMGYSDDEILSLFCDPFYQGTHDIYKKMGELYVKNIIREVRHG